MTLFAMWMSIASFYLSDLDEDKESQLLVKHCSDDDIK